MATTKGTDVHEDEEWFPVRGIWTRIFVVYTIPLPLCFAASTTVEFVDHVVLCFVSRIVLCLAIEYILPLLLARNCCTSLQVFSCNWRSCTDGFNLNHTVNPYDWVVSSDLSNIFSTIYYNNVLNMHKVYNAIYWCLGHPAERVRQACRIRSA